MIEIVSDGPFLMYAYEIVIYEIGIYSFYR